MFKKRQEEEQNKQFTIGLYVFASIIVFLILANVGVNVWNTKKAFTNCDTTISRVVSLEHHAFKVIYNNGTNSFVGEERASRAFTTLYYENGMPLEVGQEYKVAFNKEEPKYFKVLGAEFTKRTLLSYYNLTTPKIKLWLTEEGIYKEGMEHCVFKKVYQRIGIDGLAQLFYFNEAIVENIDNNSITFSSFEKQNEFKEIIKECTALYTP